MLGSSDDLGRSESLGPELGPTSIPAYSANNLKSKNPRLSPGVLLGGLYRTRTCDPYHVKNRIAETQPFVCISLMTYPMDWKRLIAVQIDATSCQHKPLLPKALPQMHVAPREILTGTIAWNAHVTNSSKRLVRCIRLKIIQFGLQPGDFHKHFSHYFILLIAVFLGV